MMHTMSSTTSSTMLLPPVRQPAESATGTPLFQISVKQYHEMIDQGILTTNDRVELLNGLLVRKMSQNTPHASMVEDFYLELVLLQMPGWKVRSQLPITLRTGEPEPDLAIVRGKRRSNNRRHPVPADFGIVIEVSDTTLRYDRMEKGPAYAAAGIPEYWIINLDEQVVEVYSQPSPDGYGQMQLYTTSDRLPLVLDGQPITTFAVAELFATSAE
jgi:Uma2 family endonuclease